MQLIQNSAFLATLFASALTVLGQSTSVSLTYDTRYDAASTSLQTTACANGPFGLLGRFPTFGSLPTFPNIGGAYVVAPQGNAECGSCWKLSYTLDNGEVNTVNFTVINTTPDGFTTSLTTAEDLTGVSRPGNKIIEVEEIDRSFCGTN